MKHLSSLLITFACLATIETQAQCSATFGFAQSPNSIGADLWVENLVGDSTTISFSWSFCDGSTDAGMRIYHPMTSGGIPLTDCLVCLQLEDSAAGCLYSVCDSVNVSVNNNAGCAAYVTYHNQGNLYTFYSGYTATGPVLYQWAVNGVLIDTTPQLTIVIDSIQFPNAAVVCLQITDASGCNSSDCVNVGTGGNPNGGGGVPCQAYFVIYPDSGVNSGGVPGNYVGFNYSSGNYGSDILWDFGDGTTSTDAYPVHTYNVPGNYIVCLAVGVGGTTCYDTYCDSSFYAFKTESNPMSHLSISAPTAVAEVSLSAIHLYPNPVNNELNITGYEKIELLRIFDLKGQQVFETKNTNGKINLSKLNTGMYFLEVHSGNRIWRNKFLKD